MAIKTFWFVFFIAGLFSATYAQREADVLHYKFSIGLNDANDTIYGNAEVKVRFEKNTSSFVFNLKTADRIGKGMKIDKVAGMGVRGFSGSSDVITVLIEPSLQPKQGDTVTYLIQYHGIPADGLIISKNKYGKRTFFADNWPNRARHWIPCVDEPGDKASVEFIVTAPDHYQVISNGIKLEETNLAGNKKLTHWKEDVPLPTKVMVIGVADFAVAHAGYVNECIPVSSWVYPENREKGFYDYAIGKDILAFYIDYIGPYGYKKLANVQSKTRFGGMENAGAIFYAEETVTGGRNEERLFAHEIVHQWFGNMATEKNFAHFWLSEGFATYLSYIYLESKYGVTALEEAMKQDREQVLNFVKATKRPVVDTTPDVMSLLNANSYQKGSWVLHMLRRQLGDAVFKKAVKEYYETYAGKNAETKDLQKVFENVSQRNLEQFFSQWLNTGENPKLEIGWKYDSKEKKVMVKVVQLQHRIFSFPLQVALSLTGSGEKSQINELLISKREETFLIPARQDAKLLSSTIDPLTSLLYEATIKEL